MSSNTNNNANKVSEIFSFAGLAFSKLGELTMILQTNQENSSGSSKWEDDDIEMLRNAVKRFGDDLHKISDNIKSKATNQIKNNIKKKSYEQAKLPLNQVQTSTPSNLIDSSTGLPLNVEQDYVSNEVEIRS